MSRRPSNRNKVSQLGFDWDRAERDRWIDEADLMPESMPSGGSTVSRQQMTGVLRVLNGYVSAQQPECWASHKTLAVKLGLRSPNEPEDSDRGTKTISRALKALEELSLVIVKPRVPSGYTKPVSHYRIVWSELMLLSSERRRRVCGRKTTAEELSDAVDQPDFESDQPDFESDQPDFESDQPDFESRPTGLQVHQSTTELLKSSYLPTTSRREQQQETKIPKAEKPVAEPDACPKFDGQFDDRLVSDLECNFYRLGAYVGDGIVPKVAARVGVEYLQRLLEYFQSRPGAWGGGALRSRLNHSQPGLSIDQGWPPAVKRVTADLPVKATKVRKSDEELLQERAQFEADKRAARALALDGDMAKEMQAGIELLRAKTTGGTTF